VNFFISGKKKKYLRRYFKYFYEFKNQLAGICENRFGFGNFQMFCERPVMIILFAIGC
jgi:hypothetical protein